MAEAALETERRFIDLYTEYRAPVRRFVFARLHQSSEADVDDIVGETFFRVFRRLSTYEDRGIPISHWIFEIAKNALVDWTRKPHAWPFDPSIHDRADASADFDFAQVLSEDFLVSALSILSERDQFVLRCRYVDGMELAAIGSLIDVDGATMKKVHQRALARVKRALEGNPARKTGRPAEMKKVV